MQCACIPGMSLAERLKATKPLSVSAGHVTCTMCTYVLRGSVHPSSWLFSSKVVALLLPTVILDTCCPSRRWAAYLDKSYPHFDHSNKVFWASAFHVSFTHRSADTKQKWWDYCEKQNGGYRDPQHPQPIDELLYHVHACKPCDATWHKTLDSDAFQLANNAVVYMRSCFCSPPCTACVWIGSAILQSRLRNLAVSRFCSWLLTKIAFSIDVLTKNQSRCLCQCCNQGHFLSSMLASLDLWEHRRKVEASKIWVNRSTIPREHSAAFTASGVPRHRFSQLQRQAGMTLNSGPAHWQPT